MREVAGNDAVLCRTPGLARERAGPPMITAAPWAASGTCQCLAFSQCSLPLLHWPALRKTARPNVLVGLSQRVSLRNMAPLKTSFPYSPHRVAQSSSDYDEVPALIIVSGCVPSHVSLPLHLYQGTTSCLILVLRITLHASERFKFASEKTGRTWSPSPAPHL